MKIEYENGTYKIINYVIKEIVKKDDDDTRKMIIEYTKTRFPMKDVSIEFYDAETIEEIIDLGIQEYLRRHEIAEENKQIEKLGKIYDGFSDSYYDTCLVKIAQKVDEVIDAVNKLKVDD